MADEAGENDGLLVFGGFDADAEPHRESLLGLGNGLLWVRGCPPEASAALALQHRCAQATDVHYPGVYLAGHYDELVRDVDGEAHRIAALVNLPDPFGLSFRTADGDAWFGTGDWQVLECRRTLDPANGSASRELLVRDPAGRRLRLTERRLVSLARPELALVRWRVVPVDWAGPLEVCATARAAAANLKVERNLAWEGRRSLRARLKLGADGEAIVLARTGPPTVHVAIAAALRVDAASSAGAAPTGAPVHAEAARGLALQRARVHVDPGAPVEIARLVAFASSRDAGCRAARDQGGFRRVAVAAGHALRQAPPSERLEAAHRRHWRRLWLPGDLEASSPRLRARLRLHAFHLLQTASPASARVDAGLPARGWQEAYFGHVFWDEIFAFPFLATRWPSIARHLLLYRHRRLDAARAAARAAGLDGAMYPWRSAAAGVEETPARQLNPLSGHWMADRTRLQRHVAAAIAYAIWTYHLATGDVELLAECSGEMLIEIARFWASVARRDARSDRWRITGVVGPDEYHNAYPDASEPGLADNAYTNVMAVWTLCRALELPTQLSAVAWEALRARTRLREAELAQWDAISRAMRLVFHEGGVLMQFEGFDRLQPAEDARRLVAARRGEAAAEERLDWALEAAGSTADAFQITKQPDVLALLHLLGVDALTQIIGRLGYPRPDRASWARTAVCYLDRITHESSLSRPVCAGALAAIDARQSWSYFEQALDTDVGERTSHGTHEGLHLGAMAASLDVLQRHYVGLGFDADGSIRLEPRVPPSLGNIGLAIRHRSGLYRLQLEGRSLSLSAAAANPRSVTVVHGGGRESLAPGAAVSVPVERTH